MGTNCLFIPASFTLVGGITFFAHGVLWGENGWCLDVLHLANRALFNKQNSLETSAAAKDDNAAQSTQALLPPQRPASSALPVIAESSVSLPAAAAGGGAGDVRVEMATVRSTARSD